MTPFEKAARWHLSHCPGEAFHDVIEAHFQLGHVLSGPHAFLIARPIRSDWPDEQVRDPWEADDAGDCWHIWLFAGDLAAIPPLIPGPRPLVSFHRGHRLVILPFPSLVSHLAGCHPRE